VVSPASQAGEVQRYSIDVENSTLAGEAFDGLYINNVDPSPALHALNIKVANTDITDSAGPGIVFKQAADNSTDNAKIDLGGGALGSAGHNNIYGNAGAVQTNNYTVWAEHDWWGTPAGPQPSEVELDGSGQLMSSPALTLPRG
jgi:hypothetical protein